MISSLVNPNSISGTKNDGKGLFCRNYIAANRFMPYPKLNFSGGIEDGVRELVLKPKVTTYVNVRLELKLQAPKGRT
jgi:hypothetical protein